MQMTYNYAYSFQTEISVVMEAMLWLDSLYQMSTCGLLAPVSSMYFLHNKVNWLLTAVYHKMGNFDEFWIKLILLKL